LSLSRGVFELSFSWLFPWIAAFRAIYGFAIFPSSR
jgi:hypothetical protein